MIVISNDTELLQEPPCDLRNPFCDCGRAALPGRPICRTCYEDAYRRVWREELRPIAVTPDLPPVRCVPADVRRELMRELVHGPGCQS